MFAFCVTVCTYNHITASRHLCGCQLVNNYKKRKIKIKGDIEETMLLPEFQTRDNH